MLTRNPSLMNVDQKGFHEQGATSPFVVAELNRLALGNAQEAFGPQPSACGWNQDHRACIREVDDAARSPLDFGDERRAKAGLLLLVRMCGIFELTLGEIVERDAHRKSR